MRFRLKMTVCMVWLLTLAYGLGGTLLITRAFDNALRREQTAALESYRTTVRTVRLVRTLGMRRDRTAVSATLERLRGTAACPQPSHEGAARSSSSRDAISSTQRFPPISW